jgi:uncharacterized membrane protein
MLARVLTRAIDAQERWAKPLGDRVHGVAAAVFGRVLPLRDLLNGTWLGHPLHSLLTDVPIGALTLVIFFDLLGQRVAADVALVFGVLTMFAAAAAGYADYSVTDGKARVRATVHSALMVAALVLYLASLVLRAGGASDRTMPVVLSFVAYLVLAGGAFVGGDIVYALGNMVDRHAWRPAGAKWQPLEVGEIPEGSRSRRRSASRASFWSGRARRSMLSTTSAPTRAGR